MSNERHLTRALDLIYSMNSLQDLREIEQAARFRIHAVQQQREQEQEEQELEFNWDYLSS